MSSNAGFVATKLAILLFTVCSGCTLAA